MPENILPTIDMKTKLTGSRIRIDAAYSGLYTSWLKFGESRVELEEAIGEANGLVLHGPRQVFKDSKVQMQDEDRLELIGTLAVQIPSLRDAIQAMVGVALLAGKAVKLTEEVRK
jgi:hypothetical protein